MQNKPFEPFNEILEKVFFIFFPVIPAKAGTHVFQKITLNVDSQIKSGNDELGIFSEPVKQLMT